ncbi:hypothetical protein I7I50_07789 [Histoplasma capsulatum G186AR]|uniref:Uncharacterized protein n=1 Tax=Ajellomyces capsulatus TaxID=5037 RepID=A0A8H7YV08_AJECA|nr:hypothetical protein I7I52_09138 [Histoplasma capsulatum]QSS68391.1 hypothetical protein I7I50_07789 [Histoplasma capsulatum G186AR]
MSCTVHTHAVHTQQIAQGASPILDLLHDAFLFALCILSLSPQPSESRQSSTFIRTTFFLVAGCPSLNAHPTSTHGGTPH